MRGITLGRRQHGPRRAALSKYRSICAYEHIRALDYGGLSFAGYGMPALSTMRIDGARIGACAAMLIQRTGGLEIKFRIVEAGFGLIERLSA